MKYIFTRLVAEIYQQIRVVFVNKQIFHDKIKKNKKKTNLNKDFDYFLNSLNGQREQG